MIIIRHSSVLLPQLAQSRLWLAVALMTGANSWSIAAETDAAKLPVATAAPISAESSKDVLRYLINSKSLSLNDAQNLLQQLRTEQSKKTSEDLLRSLINSKALSLADAQKLVENLRASQGQTSAKEAVASSAVAKVENTVAPTAGAPVAKPNGDKKPEAVTNPPTPVTPVAATTPAVATTPEKKAEATPVEPAGRVRAVYLPDSERQKIRDELKTEVLAAAKKEGWIQVDAAPEWTRRISFSGDMMLRQQGELYDDRNYDQALNFQAINSDKPLNIFANPLTPPILNTTKNRQATRLRVRLGMQAQIADDLDANFRFTTGNTVTPVSSNQTLGSDFAKVNFLLDRASLRYRPTSNLTMLGGRMANPWLAATDLVWDKDLSFDGWAAQYKRAFGEQIHTFATMGMFSVESTEGNFPLKSQFKVGSHDKWLYGIQLGGDWRGKDGLSLRGSLAYYDFANVQGELSSPCDAWTDSIACDTDHTRPTFVQKGNTMRLLRNVTTQLGADPTKPSPTFEYYGLVSPYRVVELSTTIDQALSGKLHSQFDVSVVKNLAFSETGISSRDPVNNLSPCPVNNQACDQKFNGGDMGYQLQLRVGYPQIREYGQWNTLFGYRYVESDAVMDAFTDSDFHLGGTNTKGYYLGGSVGFSKNSWLSARWLSATEVEGEPFAVDVLQLDVNTRF
ncbi:hypothetical protein FK216_13710 [Moraxellaceae bacterium AER2_44_116]|nr:putative porin [Moraxellaceae bacterium]TQC95731.1 hypothetical protein FK216_13710 [Moraxellaceae bacterium AER2_44_116]